MSGRMGLLAAEHALLGASFSKEEGASGVCRVVSYAGEQDFGDGALLCDLTGATYLLLDDPERTGLGGVALAGRELSVGECAFEGVLSGDGSLLAAPLALRTGDAETVLIDVTERGVALEAWLGFLRSAQAGGVAPYASTSLEPAHDMLVPLLLAGPAAEGVLLDYVVRGDALPAPGRVSQMSLDAIAALVARLPQPVADPASYLVFCPPSRARVLWRSLLSFTEVTPVGHDALRDVVSRELPWERAGSTGPLRGPRGQLASWGLVRAGSDFVGARALDEQAEADARPKPRPGRLP